MYSTRLSTRRYASGYAPSWRSFWPSCIWKHFVAVTCFHVRVRLCGSPAHGLGLWALDSQVFASVGTAILFPSILGFSLYSQFLCLPRESTKLDFRIHQSVHVSGGPYHLSAPHLRPSAAWQRFCQPHPLLSSGTLLPMQRSFIGYLGDYKTSISLTLCPSCHFPNFFPTLPLSELSHWT